eukprot:585071_1
MEYHAMNDEVVMDEKNHDYNETVTDSRGYPQIIIKAMHRVRLRCGFKAYLPDNNAEYDLPAKEIITDLYLILWRGCVVDYWIQKKYIFIGDYARLNHHSAVL